MHWAIKRGYYNIVVCLYKHGADLNAVDMVRIHLLKEVSKYIR